MRILMVTNKVRAYTLGFQNTIIPLQQLGHTIVWAADFSQFVGSTQSIPCKIEQISINTNPFNCKNISAYKRLLKIITEEKIEAIQCSTPIGGLLARLAGSKARICPVIYSAHGFLFFKGAPLINRTVYKLEEMILAHYTDVLITITKEDYEVAQRFKLRSGEKPYLVHGAGVESGVTVVIEKVEKRKEIDIPMDACMIVSAGELNRNKNNRVIIEAIAKMNNRNIVYVLCGTGPESEKLQKLAQTLGILDQIRLLGYRTDMAEIMSCADIFVMPSFREGVPRALLEAMDLGLPCVCSQTRGLSDLIEEGKGGFLCNPKNINGFRAALDILISDQKLRIKMGMHNKKKVKEYSKEIVRDELRDIFKESLNESG